MIVMERGGVDHTDIPVTHHHVKPHLLRGPAAEPGEGPVQGGGAPPVGLGVARHLVPEVPHQADVLYDQQTSRTLVTLPSCAEFITETFCSVQPSH